MHRVSRLHRTLPAVLLIVGLTGCGETRTSDVDIRSIGDADVIEAMDQPGTVLVDVRSGRQYAEGHIPGAASIPLPEMRWNDSRLAEAEKIVVYSAGWSDVLSRAGAKKLMALGYENVFEFKGGLDEWRDTGGRLVKGANPAAMRPETER